MELDLNDNQKIYIVKDGKLIAHELPNFGRVTITLLDGKVDRITTEESKKV